MLARSRTINETPLDYTSGMSVTGSQGACVPLPPGSASAGTYTATCNTGFTATRETGTCQVTLDTRVEARDVYGYYCIAGTGRSEEHTSELQSLMRISYAVFCLQKKNKIQHRVNSFTSHTSRHSQYCKIQNEQSPTIVIST